MDFIGFALGKVASQICIITTDGELSEHRLKTNREQLAKLLGLRPPARILIEAGTESEWVARCLEEMGHEVIVADPNFAPMYATRSRRVKTDKRDARTLAEASRLGAYRPAHRTSERQRHVRAKLAGREALVRTRSKYISLIRALVRRDGLRVATGTPRSFVVRLDCLPLSAELRAEVTPLVILLEGINEQLRQADAELAQLLTDDAVVRRLTSAPGVGVVTAACFVSTLNDVTRFPDARQVRAYIGLVPSEYSSGERHQRGRINKAGPNRARYLLVEAAWALLRSSRPEAAALRQWASANPRAARVESRYRCLGPQTRWHPLRDVERWRGLQADDARGPDGCRRAAQTTSAISSQQARKHGAASTEHGMATTNAA